MLNENSIPLIKSYYEQILIKDSMDANILTMKTSQEVKHDLKGHWKSFEVTDLKGDWKSSKNTFVLKNLQRREQ